MEELLVMYNVDKKTALMTKETYFNLIDELKEAMKDTTTKTNRQYYILKRLVTSDYSIAIIPQNGLLTIFSLRITAAVADNCSRCAASAH